jgi:hypothetical protein
MRVRHFGLRYGGELRHFGGLPPYISIYMNNLTLSRVSGVSVVPHILSCSGKELAQVSQGGV